VKGPTTTQECVLCQQSFRVIYAQSGRRKTCSWKCRSAYLSSKYKGRTFSLETRRKLSEVQKGRPSPLKGCKLTQERIARMACSRRGAAHPGWRGGKPTRTCVCGKTFQAYQSRHCSQSCARRRPCSAATRRKISAAHQGRPKLAIRGDRHPHWRGGITGWQNKIRHSIEYKNWRRAVLERDNFTCQDCGVRGGNLHADHIKPFAFFPALRFEVSNGRTLCVPCHLDTPTYGSNAKMAA